LPDKFFVEGEEVEVSQEGEEPMRAMVVDPRVHRRSRNLHIRYLDGGDEEQVPVDDVRAVAEDAVFADNRKQW